MLGARVELTKVQTMILWAGLLVFLLGLFMYFAPKKASGTTSGALKTDLTERDQAIENALRNHQSTYTYSSNFLPGVGRVGSDGKVQGSN